MDFAIINDNLVLNNYSYHYQVYDTTKLNCTFLVSSEYTQYTKNVFRINLYNKNGDYSFKWTLTDNIGKVLENSTYESFTPMLTSLGMNKLECYIVNKKSGEEKALIRFFNVILPPKLSATNISNSSDYYGFSKNISFWTKVSGGSWEYTYSWTLKDVTSGKILLTSSKPSVSVDLLKAGNMLLSCTITDIYTKEKVYIEKAFKVLAPPPLVWRITPIESQLGLNANQVFTVLTKGGSQNFSYNWLLKNSSGKTLATSSNTNFQVKFGELGKMTLSCTIKDLGAEEAIASQTQTQTFDVISVPPLLIKVLPEQLEYKIFDRINFFCQVENGSGQYNYNWVLKNKTTNKILSTTSGEYFNVQFEELGEYVLTCLVKDVVKNTSKTKEYLFNIVPQKVEFSEPEYSVKENGKVILLESYIYCTEETNILFNLWINGRFNNNQQALITIGTNQFTKDNNCGEDRDTHMYPCRNSDEIVKLAKGGHSVTIRLENLNSNITRVGIQIKDVENGNIGNRTFISIGND